MRFINSKTGTHTLSLHSQPEPTVFHENFDTGAPGWEFLDLWRESFWHVSTTGAFTGTSYWAGIEALGGYDDAWVQTLTSPAIALPTGGGITLSFMHNLAVEDFSDGYPHGYDAWDAVNVRVSTEAQNFNVIAPKSGPAYNAVSAYGFHFYYGAGVAGWSGATNGWVASSFDLSAFAGKTIWLRFELASDEAYSHADDPALFGWRIDDIKISQNGATLFFDDGGDSAEAKFIAGGPGGTKQWHLSNAAANSFPNSAGCFHLPSGNYLSNAKTALLSPAIALKTLPVNTRRLLADMKLQGSIDATLAADGNHDFLRVEYRSFRNGASSIAAFATGRGVIGKTRAAPPQFCRRRSRASMLFMLRIWISPRSSASPIPCKCASCFSPRRIAPCSRPRACSSMTSRSRPSRFRQMMWA